MHEIAKKNEETFDFPAIVSCSVMKKERAGILIESERESGCNALLDFEKRRIYTCYFHLISYSTGSGQM